MSKLSKQEPTDEIMYFFQKTESYSYFFKVFRNRGRVKKHYGYIGKILATQGPCKFLKREWFMYKNPHVEGDLTKLENPELIKALYDT